MVVGLENGGCGFCCLFDVGIGVLGDPLGDVVLRGGYCSEVLVRREEWDVFPRGVADGAHQATMFAYMRCNTREMKRVTAFRSVNSRTLSRLHAVQANSTATLFNHNKSQPFTQPISYNLLLHIHTT